MKKIVIIFAALLAAVSCQKSLDSQSSVLVFTARLSDATRVAENNGKMTWEVGDVVRISNGTSWEDVTLTESDITADGYSATFNTTTLDAAEHYYAVYPAANCGSGFTLNGGDVVVNIPQEQNPDNVFTCVSSCGDSDRLFSFKHPASLIYFYTTRNDIAKLVFHSNTSIPISGPLAVNPTTGEASWNSTASDAVSVTVSAAGKAWLELAPQEMLTGGYSVYAYDSSDNLLGICYKSANKTFERNTRYFLDRPAFSAPAASFDGYAYTSFDNALAAFNAKGSGTLTWSANGSGAKTFTAENGTLDLGGNSHNGCFFLQNNTGTITICNGTMSSTGDCTDGKSGFSDSFGGKIVFENMTVNGILWTDGHEFEIRSGTYNQIRNSYMNSDPGLVTIKGGFFKKQLYFDYALNGGWTLGRFVVEGGKFANDPRLGQNVTIADGHAVEDNDDEDKATYPFVVR